MTTKKQLFQYINDLTDSGLLDVNTEINICKDFIDFILPDKVLHSKFLLHIFYFNSEIEISIIPQRPSEGDGNFKLRIFFEQ